MPRLCFLLPLLAAFGVSTALAVDPSTDHWSFKPVVRPALPDVAEQAWIRTPVDRFILAKLEREAVATPAQADRRTLIRRLYLDMVGIPPTPEDVDAFVADPRPDAWPRLVDGLLDSPLYGQRWGRHWLDVARYADTSGDGADVPIPEARLYRDYVIDAFNADLPFNRFVIEQIAGDRLALQQRGPRWREQLIATGFVALTRRFGNVDNRYADRHLMVADTVDTVGRAFMGLSLSCARCHDHKYDPVSQKDFFGLYGYFRSTRYPHPGTEHGRVRTRFVPLTLEAERIEQYEQLDRRRRELVHSISAIGGNKGDRKTVQAELKAIRTQLKEQFSDIQIAYAVVDDPEKAGDERIHKSGHPGRRGEVAPRGFLDALHAADAEISEGESGRLTLAEWIASNGHPLTARVIVNRIWQHHFGQGLVSTPDGFGLRSAPPSHPELLDYLADAMVRGGWSIKRMHRMILLSATYAAAPARQLDDARRQRLEGLYAVYPRRRLDFEAMRDSALAVSGLLDLRLPPNHPFPPASKDGTVRFTQHRPFLEDYEHSLRSVYMASRRLGRHPWSMMFDGPDPNAVSGRRGVSTVPLQALLWMNSRFMLEAGDALADRILQVPTTDTKASVYTAWRLCLNRDPSADESDATMQMLAEAEAMQSPGTDPATRRRVALAALCRTLLSSNGFVYVE